MTAAQSSTVCMQRGNAMAETIVALLALAPFIAGVPLLGKQLDIKHKTYDTARYSVWERTVWRSDGTSNHKSEDDITLEARDRTLGSPLAGAVNVEALRNEGLTENPLWRDQQHRRLLDYEDNAAPVNLSYREQPSPVDIGYWLVPGVAYGNGVLGEVRRALKVDSLNLNPRAFAGTTVAIGIRSVVEELADRRSSLGKRAVTRSDRRPLVQAASGAVLTDTWSARDEGNFQSRIDDVTANELIEQLELPARPIGMQALGKGKQLFGEGQFGWDPDLKPRSGELPPAYLEQR